MRRDTLPAMRTEVDCVDTRCLSFPARHLNLRCGDSEFREVVAEVRFRDSSETAFALSGSSFRLERLEAPGEGLADVVACMAGEHGKAPP